MQQTSTLDRASLIPQGTYVGALRPDLPVEAFLPARSRAVLVPVYVTLVALGIVAITRLPLYLAPIIGIAIGACFAGLTFVGHEMLHGGIVRGKLVKHVLGFVCFAPFTLSPRLWVAWHGRVHHAKANLADDPDGYPTLEEYRNSRAIRFVTDTFSLGGRRWRGGLSLILGFTVQSIHQLAVSRDRLAWLETAASLALWTVVAILVGPLAFVFAYVLPLLVANAVVMAFILTNHSLSPRVEINDPLVGGLSVTTPRWLELVTLGFGYHVEHHLFPAMSTRHASEVRALIQGLWPERYQSMPLVDALRALHRTARVYKTATTLVDPRTGAEFSTLLPRAV